MSFGGGSSFGSAPSEGADVPNFDADATMNRVRGEIQAELMQGLVQDVTDKCFAVCVTRPSSSLSGGEQNCLARCQDRYVEVMSVVYAALARQAEKKASSVM